MFPDTTRVNTTVIASTVGVVIAVAVIKAWWQRKNKERSRVPTMWRRVGELSELHIYPLKSGAALPLNEAECTDIGVQTTKADAPKLKDRFFIVYSDTGIMKTARQHPNLYLIKVSLKDDGSVLFKAPDMRDLIVHIPTGTPKQKNNFKMWQEEQVEAVDCGDEASKWLHSYLDLKESETLRLGYHQEDCVSRRDCDKKPWDLFRKHYKRLRRFDTGAYSDMAPYMLLNEASVTDLRKRIPPGKTVQPSWFRSNFVVRGPEPLAEDDWNYIKIGDSAVFQIFKPCLRCIMITLNPETAIKDPDMQPLKTLRDYRLVSDPKLQALEGPLSPIMGCYMALRHPGKVRVGDPVYIEEHDR